MWSVAGAPTRAEVSPITSPTGRTGSAGRPIGSATRARASAISSLADIETPFRATRSLRKSNTTAATPSSKRPGKAEPKPGFERGTYSSALPANEALRCSAPAIVLSAIVDRDLAGHPARHGARIDDHGNQTRDRDRQRRGQRRRRGRGIVDGEPAVARGGEARQQVRKYRPGCRYQQGGDERARCDKRRAFACTLHSCARPKQRGKGEDRHRRDPSREMREEVTFEGCGHGHD